MQMTEHQKRGPFGLVVTGEAENWLPALERIVGSQWLETYRVCGEQDLLGAITSGKADAVVLDDSLEGCTDILQMLRAIRRRNSTVPVLVLTCRCERRMMEDLLRLEVFSVVSKPLALEELLRQIQAMMRRIELSSSGG